MDEFHLAFSMMWLLFRGLVYDWASALFAFWIFLNALHFVGRFMFARKSSGVLR